MPFWLLKANAIEWGLMQACPSTANDVVILCVLAEPGHVCQVLLTVSHGADDITTPVSFDLKVGRSLSDLHLVLAVVYLSTPST